MQMAEDNVQERLDDLQGRFHRTRQNAITEELLDITSGFEALRTEDTA
jgi:F-type H+-transporting ATPase subunit gamma